MKKLRLGYSSTFGTAEKWFFNTLSMRYDVEVVDPDKCDYLIFGDPNFGNDHYQYRNCKRILYTGENYRPNYFTYDHAITFDCEVSPKHYRLPLWVLEIDAYARDMDLYQLYSTPLDNHFLTKVKFTHLQTRQDNSKRPFCSFVQKNPNNTIRNQFVKLVSQYKEVSCGGPLMNNIGRVIPRDIKHKILFLSEYKFNIAFENGIYPGYETEKLIDGFYAGTIPIYLGSSIIDRDFNTKRFINCHDYETLQEVLERIKELDNDEKMYEEMMEQPIFNDPNHLMPATANKEIFLDWWNRFVL